MPTICFEGSDCCGKSTVVDSVAEWLRIRGLEYIVAKNPGATPLGQVLRTLIKQPEAFGKGIEIDPKTERILFLADNSAFVETILRKNQDKWIVMDRCNFISDIPYGLAHGLSLPDIQKIHSLISNPPLIDMLFVLRCSDQVLLERREGREEKCRIEAQGEEYLRKVNQTYTTLLEEHGHYLTHYVQSKPACEGGSCLGRRRLCAEYVDASAPINVVVSLIVEKISKLIK